MISPGTLEITNAHGEWMEVHAIRGGVFSRRGHLYLTFHFSDDVTKAGIFGFDTITGRNVDHIVVPYAAGDVLAEKIQGITIWDLDDGSAPGIEGQIHVLVLDEEWPIRDDIYLLHLRVPTADRDSI